LCREQSGEKNEKRDLRLCGDLNTNNSFVTITPLENVKDFLLFGVLSSLGGFRVEVFEKTVFTPLHVIGEIELI
jgi:hypothetical protein